MYNRQLIKANEAFNDLLNAVSREKGDLALITKAFIKQNLTKEEYFDFCQSMNAIVDTDEVDFETK